MDFPNMFHIRQVFDAPGEADVTAAVERELASVQMASIVPKGARIAITAGSRGIAHIDRILSCLVSALKAHGAHPFLFPAMGSHGGGTAEGQTAVLESLNITESTIGAPIRSSMDVVEIGRSRFGFPVMVDKLAAEADGVVVVNRIKPHTEFEGPVESGLMKMMAIGMGKHRGCFEVHKQTVHYGYRDVIPEIGAVILEKLPILFGIGIVENIYDETAMIRAVRPDQFLEEEKRLLASAKGLMARLPLDPLDVLIVDQMGKNISGTGMDTNVVGRIMFIGEKEPEHPRITRIVVLDLTEASHGNAVGIGLADYTTQRLVNKIDRRTTAINCITAMTPEKARIPIALETDREAIRSALDTIGAVPAEKARVTHIKNTLEIGELEISEALLKEVKAGHNISVIKALGPLSFDGEGSLRGVE